ncbi:hypothetical protein KRM28CT15_52860 [Krasilnikovia sp. M28-CT-15]
MGGATIPQPSDQKAHRLRRAGGRLWLPLLNGTERLGVLAFTLPAAADAREGST